MKNTNKIIDGICGLFIADSAVLASHWIYGQENDVEKQIGKNPLFAIPNKDSFIDGKDFFAKYKGEVGGSSFSAIGSLVLLESFGADTKYNSNVFTQKFVEYFGSGGKFTGYIDHVTKNTLDNISKNVSPSGANDFQSNGNAKAILTALYHGHHHISLEDGLKEFENIIKDTQNNEVAVAYMGGLYMLVREVIDGKSIAQSIQNLISTKKDINQYSEEVRESFQKCLNDSKSNTSVYDMTIQYGQACGCASTIIGGIYSALVHADNYTNAIESIALAGGDTISRAVVAGGLLGLQNGINTANGIDIVFIKKTKILDDVLGYFTPNK